jgi:hypothetical protein
MSHSTSDLGLDVLNLPPEGFGSAGAGRSAGPGSCDAKYSIHSRSDLDFDRLNLPPAVAGSFGAG